WTRLIALQIEYSLLERTVEGELIPMALELGLGVTPWSPLRGGALSGKYTRQNAGTVTADRGARVTTALGDKAYAIIDELIRIASERATTPAAVALAGVQHRQAAADRIHAVLLVQNQEGMDLYKKHGVNPVGGCLPMLLQLPFLFAFYK